MKKLLLSMLALVFSVSSGQAQTLSSDELKARQLRSRAVEAAIWGMPAVNYDLMLQEMLGKTAGKVNQFIYWGRPLDWKNQTLTPNPDTLYFMSFFDTRDVGPVVVEIPPADANGSLNANFVNVWQLPLEDAGRLGVDKGKGIKFVILPPGYAGDRFPMAMRRSDPTPSAATCYSVQTFPATATPMSRNRRLTPSRSRFIPSRKRQILRPPRSPTSRTCSSIPPFDMTEAFSSI